METGNIEVGEVQRPCESVAHAIAMTPSYTYGNCNHTLPAWSVAAKLLCNRWYLTHFITPPINRVYQIGDTL